MKLFTAKAMREIDRAAIAGMGIPSLTLMENAARAVIGALAEEVPPELLRRAVVLCGKGNNGGDGMAVARLLRAMGHDPKVLLFADPSALSVDAAAQFARLGPAGVSCQVLTSDGDLSSLAEALAGRALVVDALLGTGLGGPAQGLYARVIEAVNATEAFVVAVDIPSGLSGDVLAPIGPAVRARLTLALALPKPVLYTPEGAGFCGVVRVLDIGIPAPASDGVEPVGEALDAAWATPFFRARRDGAHKGDLGRLLIVAGSLGKSGAAVLAARGALRASAGLVTVAIAASAQPAVAAALPEAMTLPLPETKEGTLSMDALLPILDFCGQVDAVGLGPGLGIAAETGALARELYAKVPLPMAVDADGLNALSERPAGLSDHAGPRVLTPHPGEMARLTGSSAAEVVACRYEAVPARAAAWKAVLLLKGFRTLIAAPGRPWRLNLSGGPHMAGPGFGDVLTGMVAALLGRRLDAFDAAALAAWWHGAAADRAARILGGYGLLASECADALPAVEGGLRGFS